MSSSLPGWRPRHRYALAAMLGLAAWCVAAAPFTVDDAYIVARYGRRLVAGLGWTFRDGPPTDGVTGPLWMLPAALGAAVEGLGLAGASMAFPKALGAGAALAAAGVLTASAGRRFGGAAPWVAALLAVQAQLALWSVAGLETGLATLVLTFAALAARRKRGAALGAGLGALAALRPELLVAGAVLLAGLALRAPGQARRGLALASALGAALVLWRLALFGSPVPLSVPAKMAGAAADFAYVAQGLLVTTGGAGLALVSVAVFGGRRGDRVLALALGLQLAAVAVLGGDWMPGFRLLVPLLPLYAWLAGEGAARLRRRRGPGLPLALLAVAAAVPLIDGGVQLPRAREAGVARQRVLGPLARELADAGSVALVDVGYLGWRSGADVLDLGGLTEPAIARAPGGHLDKRIPLGLLEDRRPARIVLHAAAPPEVREGALLSLDGFPVERRLAASPWLRRHYRVRRVVRLHARYHYVVLARRGP